MPIQEKVPLLYVTHLHIKGLAPSSIAVHLAAVRSLHILAGYKEPVLRTAQVNLALKGMKDTFVTVQKRPIEYDLLKSMCKVVQCYRNAELWTAVWCLAFFAGLRSSEYTHSGDPEIQGPTIDCVQFSTDLKVMYYTVRRSKTKVQGFTVPVGCTEGSVCPVCTMAVYLASRKKGGTMSRDSPLFMLEGKVLVASAVNSMIQKVVGDLGLDQKHYSTHSLRSGAASTAANVGFQDWELQRLGGWKSQVYKQYIREVDNHVAGFAARLTSRAAQK